MLSELTSRIAAAPFEPASWPLVLEDMANALGGWGGQLVATEQGRVAFCLADENVSDDMIEEFLARRGADPNVNPRWAAMLNAPAMRERYGIYREFFDRVDSPAASMARLSGPDEFLMLTIVNHRKSQGPPDDARLGLYQALLPHLKSAARIQLALEDQASAIALGALETLSIAALLCDHTGRILAMSAKAGEALEQGSLIVRRGDTLSAASPAQQQALADAIERAASFQRLAGPRASTMLLCSVSGDAAQIVDIAPLPSTRSTLRIGARALVILGGPARRRQSTFLIELGLTEAEAEVVSAMLDGASTREIADRRSVRFETVRTQIKSIYAKLRVRRQSELFKRLRGLV